MRWCHLAWNCWWCINCNELKWEYAKSQQQSSRYLPVEDIPVTTWIVLLLVTVSVGKWLEVIAPICTRIDKNITDQADSLPVLLTGVVGSVGLVTWVDKGVSP